jgi:hypothetical protein
MSLRFTIRDLLLLTFIVALALGWWLDRGKLERKCSVLEQSADTSRTEANMYRMAINQQAASSGWQPPKRPQSHLAGVVIAKFGIDGGITDEMEPEFEKLIGEDYPGAKRDLAASLDAIRGYLGKKEDDK